MARTRHLGDCEQPDLRTGASPNGGFVVACNHRSDVCAAITPQVVPRVTRLGKRGFTDGSRLAWRGWVAVACFVVVLGAVGSALAARTVAQGDGQRAQRAFEASSASVVSSLRRAIEREQDLVVNTSA